MNDDADAVLLGEQMDMACGRYGTENLGLKSILEALARIKLRTAVAQLDDDVRLGRRRGFECGIESRGARDVDRGDRVATILGGGDEVSVLLAGHDTRMHGDASHFSTIL